MKIVECVPNISEGRVPEVYNAVAQAAAAVPGVKLLDVDPGVETNRTVITFVGEPEAVLEGAFQLVIAARGLIDMRGHHGAHGRMGAVDVCPFVPVAGVTMDDCVDLANRLAQSGRRGTVVAGLPVRVRSDPSRTAISRGHSQGRVRGPAPQARGPRLRPRLRSGGFRAGVRRDGDRRPQISGRLQRQPQRLRQEVGESGGLRRPGDRVARSWAPTESRPNNPACSRRSGAWAGSSPSTAAPRSR